MIKDVKKQLNSESSVFSELINLLNISPKVCNFLKSLEIKQLGMLVDLITIRKGVLTYESDLMNGSF